MVKLVPISETSGPSSDACDNMPRGEGMKRKSIGFATSIEWPKITACI